MAEAMNNANVSMRHIHGRALRCATWGLDQENAQPPILFFNGIGANIEAVAPLAATMTERGFILFDMPGTGGSPDPVVPYTPASISMAASQLLRDLDVEKAHIMGISWGGAIAQQFALQHPDQTGKLVLLASGTGSTLIPGSAPALAGLLNPASFLSQSALNRMFFQLYGGADASGDPHRDAAYIGELEPPSARGYWYQLAAMAGWTSLPALPFLRAETLIMMGRDDQIVSVDNGVLLNTLIPRSKLKVIEHGGHLFMLTHPRESLAEIRDFLEPDRAAKPEPQKEKVNASA